MSSGLRDLARGIAANLAAIAQSRLELFSIELQEEKYRLIQVLIWASAAIFCGAMAFVLINVTVVYLFWESARLTVLLVLTFFYTFSLGGIAFGLKRYIGKQPLPFADTIQEFKKDRECFRKRN